MIKLVIDGKEADVLQTESIVGEYAVAPIGDISKRVGARSIQFKLPKTAKNKAIFESGEIPTSTSNKPYTNLSCRIYVDGVDMNMVFCQLETVDDNYNIRMYGGNSTLFADLKNKKLADLDLNHLNHHWNVDHIAVSKDKDYPLKYAVVDYNSDSPNSAIDETNDRAYIGCLYPVLYQHYLIEKCINEAGYTLNNQTKDALMFQSAYPVVPLGSRTYERDKDFTRHIGNFYLDAIPTGSVGGLIYTCDSIVSQNQVYWEQYFNSNTNFGAFIFTDPCKVNYELYINLYNNGASTETIYIDVIATHDLVGGIANETVYKTYTINVPVTGYPASPYQWSVFEELNIYNDANRYVRLGFVVRSVLSTNVFNFAGSDNYFKITNCTVNDEQEYNTAIFYKDTPLESRHNYVTVANNLPDFSQADFIKQYLTATNSITTVDERNKVVTIVPYKKILDNITNAIDWTGKIDFTNRPKTEFKLDYAQNNYLKYKEDNDVIKPIGTDYNMTIDDERLEYEKTLIQLLYSATESATRCNRTIAKINSFKDYLVDATFNPRSLLIRFEDFSFEYRENTVNSTGAVTITTDVPICYFIDDNQEYSNGFDKNLFENFFTFIIGIITKTKVIEVDMRLTISDIANFDPLFPVYIGEFDAHFYVNKIKFDYTKRNSSVVELVKLL
jgi:hypothetical protein